MKGIIELKGVSKVYQNFHLKPMDLSIPKGYITGFIGENGAGKTTTIKLILDAIKKDTGTIHLFGRSQEELDKKQKEQIGVVMEEGCLPEELTIPMLRKVMRNIYQSWQEYKFDYYLEKFRLEKERDSKKKIKQFSKGMKSKLSLAAALSHQPRLLIMDEATSGLDPVIRNEILEVFLDFIQEEEHSIFVSSHILSDLEKICDQIVYISKGEIIFNERKDELEEKYALLKCSREVFQSIDKTGIIGAKEGAFGVEALVKRREMSAHRANQNLGIERSFPKDIAVEKASMEEIMLYHSLGGVQ